MSNVVEQKILEMRFDNKQFEENVSESISTLDKLKGALNFDKVSDCFNSVTQAAGKVDLSPISNSVETVIVKFNALELAVVQAVSNIITNGINRLESAVNSVTFDQISAGWSKLEEKTQSVQTIMNATGKEMSEVNEQLERLNWFSDETSYSFTDMTSNVGKFTSVGVELEDAVSAMEGIATWAALSGANSQTASRAMYNLSQAMGVGAVKLMDWRSIENAGMATEEFKNTVLDTAAALGTLNKFADGTYQTLDGVDVSVQNFSSTLSEGWFDKDVLMESLDAYGSYANELSKICNETGKLATDMDQAFADWFYDARDFDDIAKDLEIDADDLRVYFERLTDTSFELGRKAFIAAQEAKTFTDVIDATQDAVSTKWMNIFEAIFGNYEEAKDMYTKMAGIFYDMFAAPLDEALEFLDTLNDVEKFVDEQDRNAGQIFRTGLLDTLHSVNNVIQIVKSTIAEIIPPITAERVFQLVKRFGELAETLNHVTGDFSITEYQTERLRAIWDGLSSVFSIIKELLKALSPAFSALKNVVFSLADDVLSLAANFGRWLTDLSTAIKETGIFQKVIEDVTAFLSPLINKVKELYSAFKEKIRFKIFENGDEEVDRVNLLKDILDKIDEKLKAAKDKIEQIKKFFEDIFTSVSNFVQKIDVGGIIDKLWEFLKSIPGAVDQFVRSINLEGIASGFLNVLQGFGSGIITVLKGIGSGVKSVFQNFNLGQLFTGIGEGISGIFNAFGTADFSGLFKNLTQGMLIFQGFNLGSLMGSTSKGINALTAGVGEQGIGGFLKGLISPVTDVFDQLKETIGSFTKDTDADKLKAIAVAIGVLAASLLVLSGVDQDKMFTALEGMAGIMLGLFAEMKGLSKIDFSNGKQFKNIGLAMVEIAAACFIMAEAVKPFAEMDTNQIIKALGAMTVMLTEFGLFTLAFSKIAQTNQIGNTEGKGLFGLFQKSNGWDKQMKNVAFAMIELGAAMKLFASAVKDFGDNKNLKDSIIAMTAVMTEMVGFIAVVSLAGKYGDLKSITAVTFGMIELAVAMKIFADALQGIASISESDQSQLGNAIIGMTAVMVEMAAFIAVASLVGKKSGEILVISGAMVVLGIAMNSFADAMKVIGELNYLQIINAVTAMADIFVGMLGFLVVGALVANKSGQILVIAASMVVLGEAFKVFADAMEMFGREENTYYWMASLTQMAAVFAAMLAFIGVAAAASSYATQILVISASMVVFGLAMQTFAAAAEDFNSVQWEDIGKAGAVLGGLVIAIGALAAIGTVAGPGLMSIGTGLMLIGGGIALIGVGLSSLEIGLFLGKLNDIGQRFIWMSDNLVGLFTNLRTKFSIDAFLQILQVIPTIVTGFISGFIAGIISGLGTIFGSFGDLLEGAKTAILAFLDFAEEVAPEIIDTFLTIILETLTSLSEKAPEILTTLLDLVVKLLDGLVDYAPILVEKLAKLFVALIDKLTEHIPEMLTSFMNFVGALFGEILKVVEGTDQQTLLKLAEMFTGLVAVIVVLDLIKSMIPGAMAGLAEISLFVAELALIIAAFGALNSIPGFQWLVEKGGDLLEAVGTAIGKFVGSIVGGFMESATSTLPQVGKNIADFWKNIEPFIAGVSEISLETTAKVAVLSACIMALTASDLIGGIADFMRDKLNIQDFGVSIKKMWNNIKPFIEDVGNLDSNTTKSVEALSKAILTLTAAQLIDGITSFVFGKADIDKFGESIGALGPHLAKFSDSVKDIDNESVKVASEAISLLADTFSNGAFKTGGLIQWFSGEMSDLKKFGEGLVALGPMIKQYANSVAGLDNDVIKNSTIGAGALSEMANKLPKKGGLVGELKGESDLVDFAVGLAALGPQLKIYAMSVKGLDTNVVTNSINAATAISELATKLPEKSLMDRIFGKDAMVEFAQNLNTFGTALKEYYDNIAGIEYNQMAAMVTATEELFNLFSGESGVTFKIDKDFKRAMKDIANSGITEFVTALAESVETITTAGTEFITNFANGVDETAHIVRESFDTMIQYCLDKVTKSLSTYKRAGKDLMENFALGISNTLKVVKASVNTILNALYDQVTAETLKASFKAAGEDLMTKFKDGLLSKALEVAIAAAAISTVALEQFNAEAIAQSYYNAGSNAMTSYISGMDSQTEAVKSACYTAGSGVISEFARGMESQAGHVQQAAAIIAASARSTVEGELSQLRSEVDNWINNNVDFNPVITPTIDTSDLDAALADLREKYKDVLDSDTSGQLAVGISGIANITGGISNTQTVWDAGSQTNVEINVNGYDYSSAQQLADELARKIRKLNGA